MKGICKQIPFKGVFFQLTPTPICGTHPNPHT